MTTTEANHQRNYNSVGRGGDDSDEAGDATTKSTRCCHIVGPSDGYRWSVLEKSLWTWTWCMLLLAGGVSRSWAASATSPDKNPIIDSVESGTVYNRSPRGIPSGGIVVIVLGKNLDAVKQPKILVSVRKNQYEGPCEVESPVLMKCRSPAVPAEKLKDLYFDADNPLLLDYGFTMDNFTKYRKMPVRFMLFPDPKYYFFEDKDRVKNYKNDYLTINGEYLDHACDNDDVRVEIGTRICNVTSLSRSQLTCRPPTRQPPARNADGSSNPLRIPDVVVIVGGGSLNFTIGKLRYESPGIMVAGGLPLSLNDLIQYWKNILETFISHFI